MSMFTLQRQSIKAGSFLLGLFVVQPGVDVETGRDGEPAEKWKKEHGCGPIDRVEQGHVDTSHSRVGQDDGYRLKIRKTNKIEFKELLQY